MSWLDEFSRQTVQTDRLTGREDHVRLLAAGLMGECGSVLTELKKKEREREAYPAYRGRMVEELGDFLWYYVRFLDAVVPELLPALALPESDAREEGQPLALALELGSIVGRVLAVVQVDPPEDARRNVRDPLEQAWATLARITRAVNVDLQEVADRNLQKVRSRWPEQRCYYPLFDDTAPEEEQLPRRLAIEFRERQYGGQRVTVLRCNGLNFGDRLTDNIVDPDGYRYHDIFHFAYAVHLGWSPVIRSLLRAKRKSVPATDENEDGGRARVVEEGVAAMVFSRAKHLGFFDGVDQVDYDLLKIIRDFVLGFEVDAVPLWQWEVAILEGFRVFRLLRTNRGGSVELDLRTHTLTYTVPEVRQG